MPDVTIGNIKVGVIPDFTGFAEKLRAGLGPAMQQAMSNFQTANQRISGNAGGSASAAAHIANAQSSSGFGLGNRFLGSVGYAPPGFAGMNGSGAQVADALTRAANSIERAADRLSHASSMGGRALTPAAQAVESNAAAQASTGMTSRFGRRFPFFPYSWRGVANRAAYAGLNSATAGEEGAAGGMLGGIGLGGAAAIGVGALAVGSIYKTGVKQLENEHEWNLMGMMGSSPFDKVRWGFNKFEEGQHGAILLWRKLAENFADASGVNPGGFLTHFRDKEKELTDILSLEELRNFHHADTAKARTLQLAAEESQEVNPEAIARIRRRREGGERNLDIMSSYGDMEAKFNPGDPRRRALEAEEKDRLQKSIDTNRLIDAGAQRDEYFTYRLQTLQNFGAIDSSNYRMRGQNRDAIVSETAYAQAVFEATKSRLYDVNAPGRTGEAAREAAGHAYDRITQEGRERLYNYDLDADRASFMVRGQYQSLGILTSTNPALYSPAMRAMAAQANDLVRQTQLSAFDAFRAGRSSDVPYLYQIGQRQGALYKQQFLNGLRPSEIDPTRTALTGKGTEDPGVILASIDRAIQQLTKIPSQLQDLMRQMGVSGPPTAQ